MLVASEHSHETMPRTVKAELPASQFDRAT